MDNSTSEEVKIHPDYENFSNTVKSAITVLCNELEKVYPGINSIKYTDEELTLSERMTMGLYLEFIRMGILTISTISSELRPL